MNIQQRPFFQTARNATYACRQTFRSCLCGWVVAIMALLFISCTSLTPERIAVLTAIAGQASQIGARDWLNKHPDDRKLFEAIAFELTELAKAGITTTNENKKVAEMAAVERLNFLPTSTLSGPDGAVYIGTADIVIWDGRKAVTVDRAATAPIIEEIRRGLKRALAPMPPAPVPMMPNRMIPPKVR